MTGVEANGRIRLSWPQIAWAIATLVAVIASWYDTRTQIALVRQELSIRVQQKDAEHARMWKSIDANAEAAAAERPKPRR